MEVTNNAVRAQASPHPDAAFPLDSLQNDSFLACAQMGSFIMLRA